MASPTMLHQGLVQLFTNSPALAVQLLRKLGAKLPPFVSIRDASADLGELSPTELRADAAIKLLDALDRVCFGIIVEAQLRFMEEKLYSFPAYATNLRVRERCPTCVLVVTPSRSVARRLRKPIVIGPGMEMKVFVIGPESIPKICDIAEAKQNPELAVLSAMAHGRGARAIALEIATAATEACAGLDSEYRLLYSDLIVKQLGVAARREAGNSRH